MLRPSRYGHPVASPLIFPPPDVNLSAQFKSLGASYNGSIPPAPRAGQALVLAPPTVSAGSKTSMQFVYILRSEVDGGIYIGCSSNIDSRFVEHQKGLVDSTKNRRPLKLLYYEAYPEKEMAFEREKSLKSFGSAYVGIMKRLKIK